jgi:hypothetical protein
MIEWIKKLFRPYIELKTGIINLKSGTAFQGVIYKSAGDWLILRQAKLLPDKKPIDGEVLIKKSDIDFVQILL